MSNSEIVKIVFFLVGIIIFSYIGMKYQNGKYSKTQYKIIENISKISFYIGILGLFVLLVSFYTINDEKTSGLLMGIIFFFMFGIQGIYGFLNRKVMNESFFNQMILVDFLLSIASLLLIIGILVGYF